ncbi:MAG: hypothetical protein JWP97_5855 [Labilithrix sp.]|nr:hypothetical protein [Labilithrix sp.]
MEPDDCLGQLGRRMKHTVFALEICAPFESGSRLHAELHRLLTTADATPTLQQKWRFYQDVARELLAGLSRTTQGCWDYFEDDAQARASYDQWVAGMVTEEGARPGPSGDDPYRGAPRYLTWTMAFLMVEGSGTDLAIRQLCDVPEPQLWNRSTFRRILLGLGALNFASIKSDVAYLIPRDDGWGLTAEDLAHPKFEYLRPLV